MLKGVAILFVIITHYSWSQEERLKFGFPFWIDMAVPIFMCVTGYVYSKSYDKDIDKQNPLCFQKILNCWIRYSIPYAAVFIVERILYYQAGDRLSTLDIIDLLLQGGRGPGSYYYPIMMQIPVVLPFMYYLIRKKGRNGYRIILICNIIYEILQWSYGLNWSCAKVLFIRYLFIITTGIYLAESTNQLSIQHLIMFLIGMLFIIALKYYNYEPIIITGWPHTCFIACFYIIPILMLLFKYYGKLHFHFRLLELIGKASWTIFLTQKIFYCFPQRIYLLIQPFSKPVQLLITIVFIVACGLCFYYINQVITGKIIRLITYIQEKKESRQRQPTV